MKEKINIGGNIFQKLNLKLEILKKIKNKNSYSESDKKSINIKNLKTAFRKKASKYFINNNNDIYYRNKK